ncbi:MAG: hypothetical protein AAGD25_21205 [Cyanobacteria bacterium P01_F01_bin.150]
MTSKLYRVLFIATVLAIPLGLVKDTQPTIAQSESTSSPNNSSPNNSSSIRTLGSLGDFNPERDGFRFTNADLTRTIHRRDNPSIGDHTAIMQAMFGDDVCLEGTGNEAGDLPCVLIAPSQRWITQQIEATKYGVCEGMAIASLYLWLARQSASNWNKPSDIIPVGMEEFLAGNGARSTTRDAFLARVPNDWARSVEVNNPNFQSYAAILFAMQGIHKVYKNAERHRNNKTPSQMLETLATSLQNNQFDASATKIYTVGIYQRDEDGLTQGHTLLPYKIQDMGDGIKHVFVYDSNYVYTSNDLNETEGAVTVNNPNEAPSSITPEETYLKFEGDRWSYIQPEPENAGNPLYQGNETTKNLDLLLLSAREPRSNALFHECTFCKNGDSEVEISFLGLGDLMVRNAKTSNPVSMPDIPSKGGLEYDIPATYLLPTNTPYQIELLGEEISPEEDALTDGSDNLLVSNSGYMFGFNADLRNNSKVVSYYDAGNSEQGQEFTFKTTENEINIPGMFIDFIDVNEERNTNDENSSSHESADVSYAISIKRINRINPRKREEGFNLAVGEGFAVRLDSTNKRLYFADNNQSEDTYQFEITRVSKKIKTEESIDVTNRIETVTTRNSSSVAEETFMFEVSVPAQKISYLNYRDVFEALSRELNEESSANLSEEFLLNLPIYSQEGELTSTGQVGSPLILNIHQGEEVKIGASRGSLNCKSGSCFD